MVLILCLAPLHLLAVAEQGMELPPIQQTLEGQVVVELMLAAQLRVEMATLHQHHHLKEVMAVTEYRQIPTLGLEVVEGLQRLVEMLQQARLQMLLVALEPHRLLAVLL